MFVTLNVKRVQINYCKATKDCHILIHIQDKGFKSILLHNVNIDTSDCSLKITKEDKIIEIDNVGSEIIFDDERIINNEFLTYYSSTDCTFTLYYTSINLCCMEHGEYQIYYCCITIDDHNKLEFDDLYINIYNDDNIGLYYYYDDCIPMLIELVSDKIVHNKCCYCDYGVKCISLYA